MKIYRRMDIGSAKPTPDRIRDTPYHLVNLREPWESFSVGDYTEELARLGPQLPTPWLFCGGTPFYLHALLEGIFPGPAADDALRERLRERAARDGTEALHAQLAQWDPPAAEKIHATDERRLIRALEVIELCGERFSELQQRRRPVFEPGSYRLLGIARPRAELYERIDQRVDRMFELGWVEEVERLRAEHDPPWSQEASQSIGYVEILDALQEGEDPLQRCERIKTRTHRFARSQMTWFRKMPIEWWDLEDTDELLEDLARGLESYQAGGALSEPDAQRLAYRDR